MSLGKYESVAFLRAGSFVIQTHFVKVQHGQNFRGGKRAAQMAGLRAVYHIQRPDAQLAGFRGELLFKLKIKLLNHLHR